MENINCWEYKKCGREPGGTHADELGICPAATATKLNGMNGGLNGGRICWFVSDTTCNETVQSTVAQKFAVCLNCDFYDLVKDH